MKNLVLKLTQRWLSFLARRKIFSSKPKIITITGSFGKTSTKEAIYLLLAKKFGSDVGKNWGNMNSVIGLPLAILGLRKYSFGPIFIFDLLKAFWGFFFFPLPKILVFELGIDRPGEMDDLLKIVTPDIGVLTGVSETHLEELGDIKKVLEEKMKMVKAIKNGGTLIINANDENLKDVELPSKLKIVKYGKDSNVSYSDLEINIFGSSFNLKIDREIKPVESKLLGEHSVGILLAAAAVASEFGIKPQEIVKVLEQIKPQKGRMNPIKIKNQMIVIDDSYNSNPRSAIESLKTIAKIKWSERKVAILGNMNELGAYTKKGHQLVGEEAGRSVDLLLIVGPNVGNFKSGAEKAGMSKEKIFSYANTEKLILDLEKKLLPKDLILVKASQNKMRFERVVEALVDDREASKNLLVRQEKKWQKIV